MASQDMHSRQQQRPQVEARLKTLVNNDLKDICKAYGLPVSGTKMILQKRCIGLLDGMLTNRDARSFDEFSYRVSHRGQPPPASSTASGTHANSFATGNMANGSKGSQQMPMSASGQRAYFKPSPFYELVETLLPFQTLPAMPQNRHTVKADLSIRQEIAQDLRNDNSLRIMLYCGSTAERLVNANISFPSQIEVKINDQDVKANFKGLKNKPGSTKPADVTSFIRKYNNQKNTIQITYALTTKNHAFTIHLERYVSPTQLTEKIKKAHVIPKKQVLEEMRVSNADPDIAATSVRMSLKDPVSTMRITLPVRSTICKHNQCFDGEFFMQLQDQAPQWSCPVCNKIIPFESLCIDKYFEDILLNTPKSIEKVDIEPNGEWRIIKEEEEEAANQPNGHSKNERAHYDDDFDDELVDLDTPPSGPRNPVNGSTSIPSFSLPNPAVSGLSVQTPPASSREPSASGPAPSNRRSDKRPPSAIIDLTASDDEEEEEQPIRPAKRQQTGTNTSYQGNAAPNSTSNTHPNGRYSHNSLGFANSTNPNDPLRLPPLNNSASYTSAQNNNSRMFNSQSPQLQSPAFQNSSFAPPAWPASQPAVYPPHSPLSMRQSSQQPAQPSLPPPPSTSYYPPQHHRNGSGGGGGGGGSNRGSISAGSSTGSGNNNSTYNFSNPNANNNNGSNSWSPFPSIVSLGGHQQQDSSSRYGTPAHPTPPQPMSRPWTPAGAVGGQNSWRGGGDGFPSGGVGDGFGSLSPPG